MPAADTDLAPGTPASDRSVVPYIFFAAALYAAAFLAGLFVPSSGGMQRIDDLRSALEPYRELPGWELFLAILLNNAVKAFLVLALGLLFGVFPIVSVASNGYFLGLVCLYASGRMGLGTTLLAVLPHGLFEIPAVVLSAGYGLWLGAALYRRVRYKEPEDLRGRVRRAAGVYVKAVLPLLAAAALVESLLIEASRR